MTLLSRLRRIPLPVSLARIFPALFLFSLILEWSSGYKNAVVWLAALFLLRRIALGKRKGHAGGLGAPILGLLVVALISAWFSMDRALSMRQLGKFPELLAGYWVLVHLLPEGRRVERAADGWVWAMGGVALLDFARLALSALRGEPVLDSGRWFGSILGFPTIAAGLYATTVAIAAAGWMGEPSARVRWVRGAMLAAFGALLYLLQTRSVLLGLGIGMIPVVALSPARGRWKGMAAAGAVAVALLLLLPGAFRTRLLAGSWSDRAALWSDAHTALHRAIEKEPARAWIGYGYGHTIFERLHRTLPRRLRTAERIYDHAHNLFLEIRVQSGYLGLLAWAGLLFSAGWRVIRQFPPSSHPELRQITAGLAGGLVCLLIYGQFSVLLALQPILLFWSLLAALMAACAAGNEPISCGGSCKTRPGCLPETCPPAGKSGVRSQESEWDGYSEYGLPPAGGQV